MPPWDKFAPTEAQAQTAGPWQKFAASAPSDPDAGWGEPGAIVPVQFKEGTGEMRWAMPKIVTDTISAIEGPGKALQGDYGLEIDPETGRPTTITNDMIGDAMGAAGMGLSEFAPAAQAGAKFGQAVIGGGAKRMLQREMGNAGIPLEQVGSRLAEIGPNAVVADLSPGLQARAAAIATMPGSGQKSIVDALSARRAGANARIIGDVDATVGPAPVPSYVRAGIQKGQSDLGPQYDALFKAPGVSAVDTTDIANALDSMSVTMRGESANTASTIRKMLDVFTSPEDRRAGQGLLNAEWKANGSVGSRPIYQPPLDTSPETLHETRKAVGGMLAAQERTIGADPTTVGTLKYIYAQINKQLAEAVPGIKEVDAQYQEFARQKDALDLGQELLDSGRTAKRPEEVADLMNGPTAPRRLPSNEAGPSPQDPVGGPRPAGSLVGPSQVPLMLRAGARAEIDRIIGTNVNDVTAMKRIVAGEGNWNRDRLASVFGPEKAARLLGVLEREAKYAATDSLALQGSRTQVLKAAQEDIVGKGPRANPVRSAANFRFGDAAADVMDNGLGWLFKQQRANTNSQMADALMSGPDNLRMLSAIAAKGPGVMQRAPLAALRVTALEPDVIGNLSRLALGHGR